MIKLIDDRHRSIRSFLLQHQDSLRLLANGLGLPRREVEEWIKNAHIPPNTARTIYQRYKKVEAYNLRLQGNKSLELLGKH